jgi:hypothetical protein
MNPTTGTFVSTSADHASMNFAIAYGEITVIDRPALARFIGKMPIVSFAWLNANLAPRHRPIIHSKN